MKSYLKIALVVLFLALPVVVSAHCGCCEQNDVSQKFYALENEVPSLYLHNALHMTKEQYADLLGIMNKQEKIDKDIQKKCDRVMKRNKRYVKRLEEDIIDLAVGGKKRTLEKLDEVFNSGEIRQIRNELWQIKKGSYSAKAKLQEKAFDVLSESQRNVVDNFEPCFIPKKDFRNPERVGQAKGDTTKIEKALDLLRVSESTKSERALERAVESLIPYFMKDRRMEYNGFNEGQIRDELTIKLQSAQAIVVAMGKADYTLEKSDIAEEIFYRTGEGEAASLEEIQWKIARYVINPGIKDVIAGRAGVEYKAEGETEVAAMPSVSVNAAKSIKKSAYVIQGLNLSPEQAVEMAELVNKALEERNAAEKKTQDVMDKALYTYERVREQLASKAGKVEGEGKAGGFHGKVRKMNKIDNVQVLLKYEKEMDCLLAASQVEFLTKGEASAPKALSEDEEAIVEAIEKGVKQAERVLSKVRRMPDLTFEKQKKEVSREFIIDRLSDLGLKTKGLNVDKEVERSVKVLEQARALDKKDFKDEERGLAEDLYSQYIRSKAGVDIDDRSSEWVRKSIHRSHRFISSTYRMPKTTLERKKDEICREYIKDYLGRENIHEKTVDIEKEVKRIGEVVMEARGLSRPDYNKAIGDLAAEACPRRKKPRKAKYGKTYIGGKPVQELGRHSKYIFTETAKTILDEKVEKYK
ncbi:hypothetical protein BVX94_01100 [bacterium B17]|nr:hypothetical protein BVX94_01100 [bacterium B17]